MNTWCPVASEWNAPSLLRHTGRFVLWPLTSALIYVDFLTLLLALLRYGLTPVTTLRISLRIYYLSSYLGYSMWIMWISVTGYMDLNLVIAFLNFVLLLFFTFWPDRSVSYFFLHQGTHRIENMSLGCVFRSRRLHWPIAGFCAVELVRSQTLNPSSALY